MRRRIGREKLISYKPGLGCRQAKRRCVKHNRREPVEKAIRFLKFLSHCGKGASGALIFLIAINQTGGRAKVSERPVESTRVQCERCMEPTQKVW